MYSDHRHKIWPRYQRSGTLVHRSPCRSTPLLVILLGYKTHRPTLLLALLLESKAKRFSGPCLTI